MLEEEELEDLKGFWTALWPSATWCVSSHVSCLGILVHNECDPRWAGSLKLNLELIRDLSQDEWDGFIRSTMA